MRIKMILPALTEAKSPLFRPIEYSLLTAAESSEGARGKILSPLCPDQTSRVPETCEITLSAALEEGLQNRFQAMQNDSEWRRWQSARLSNWRAYQQLSTIFAATE